MCYMWTPSGNVSPAKTEPDSMFFRCPPDIEVVYIDQQPQNSDDPLFHYPEVNGVEHVCAE